MAEPLPPPTLEQQRDYWRRMFVDMRRYRDAYREDFERAEAAIQRAKAVERKLWEQVAYLKAAAVLDRFDRGRLVALQDAHGELLAALDSTDPVEAAPEKQQCICGTPGTGDFDGPRRDCPVHGEPSDERYCFCPDCIRCGCGMWEKHHADLSEIIPVSAQRPEERSDEGPKNAFRACADCGDDIWPGEPPGAVCAICQATAPVDGEERK